MSREIHIWRAELDREFPAADPAPEERERAARFRLTKDRDRYLAAHALLREILARYTESSPAALRFHRNPQGKPYLEGGDVRFNLSHSGKLLLCAVGRGFEVGIDVEQVRVDAGRSLGFCRDWTRREAYWKARGLGLSGMNLPPAAGWSVVDLQLGPDYAGAVAMEGDACPLVWHAI